MQSSPLIKKMNGTTEMQCSSKCAQLECCKACSYSVLHATCELHGAEPESPTNVMVADHHYRVWKKKLP